VARLCRSSGSSGSTRPDTRVCGFSWADYTYVPCMLPMHGLCDTRMCGEVNVARISPSGVRPCLVHGVAAEATS